MTNCILKQMTTTTPTEFWNDTCEVESLRRAVEWGATGATSNPVIVLECVKKNPSRWIHEVAEIRQQKKHFSEIEIAWELIRRLALLAMPVLKPLYEQSRGRQGRVTIQVNPVYFTNTDKMIEHALEISQWGENLAIKIPAVEAGFPAMEELTARGLSILSTIQYTLPQAIATAEAFERGYLAERDFDGYRPQWGSAETLIHLVKLIGLRQGIGAVLGDGVRIAARTFGIPDDADFVIHVKGLELPMHDPRAYNSLAVAYATSNRGACHLQGFTHPFERGLGLPELGYEKPLDRCAVQGKGRFTVTLQNLMCVFDSLKVCKFLLTSGLPLRAMTEWTSRAAGWDVDLDELMLTGERIFNLKRMYNVEHGINRKDDTLPIRILSHRRGSGGSAENLPQLEPMLSEYYEVRGWDENGVPGQRTLRQLGLDAAQ